MTPEDFATDVLPTIVARWQQGCFCQSPGFQKLVRFNFRDYGHSPICLIDSEFLIEAIIRKHFVRKDEPKSHQGEITQHYNCPQCQAESAELYAEFSINMYQSTVSFSRQDKIAETGLYLVGFRGFELEHMKSISDYNQSSCVEEFCQYLYDA